MTSVWETDACWERNRHLLLSLKSFFIFYSCQDKDILCGH